jgi:cytochrome P450
MVSLWIILVFLLLCVCIKWLMGKKSRLPPGPRGLPFIGNVHQLGTSPFVSHSEMANKYGDIHTVSLFGHPVVVLSSLKAIEEFRAASPDNFTHRPVWLTWLDKLVPGLVFKGTTEYQVPRRFFLTNLKRQGMGKLGLEPQILEEAEMLMAHLEEVGVFDPNKTLANYTSNNVMRMVAGQRWQYGDPAYKEFIDAINIILDSLQVLMLEDLVPMFRYLPDMRKARKETAVATTHIRSLFRKIVEERMAEKDSVENEDFIQSYIKEHEEMEEDEVVKLIDLCQLAFIAGTETTNATLNFAIVHLLNNPSWQEELFQEVTAVLGGEVPSMAILEKLPKLEATIQETLRVNPNAPLTFRATSQVTKVRDYVVPANCMVLVNVYHINYDPEIFPNPSAFNPIRWLRPDGTFNRDLVSSAPSFGTGRRICAGQPLARMELVLLLASLVQRYVLTAPEGCKVPSGQIGGDTLTVRPDDYSLFLQKRREA